MEEGEMGEGGAGVVLVRAAGTRGAAGMAGEGSGLLAGSEEAGACTGAVGAVAGRGASRCSSVRHVTRPTSRAGEPAAAPPDALATRTTLRVTVAP